METEGTYSPGYGECKDGKILTLLLPSRDCPHVWGCDNLSTLILLNKSYKHINMFWLDDFID